ncbi:hypothetical protein [Rhizobium leguminosarum]|uniref:hypothetical protein n=1 Tax=Rhizobium leguminosarum TaxID=384 RepID=UPI00144292C7|nr:hypothetical protein [Rhizobium leguminosarum]MBY5864197.1 hypothetical protein [Rhizobium leguminosarum]NKM03211.1 hypothetical protein [Rhizobium leguminosarum bv. viciae]
MSSILIAPALKRVAAAIWTPAATINCVRANLCRCCRAAASRGAAIHRLRSMVGVEPRAETPPIEGRRLLVFIAA